MIITALLSGLVYIPNIRNTDGLIIGQEHNNLLNIKTPAGWLDLIRG